MRKDADHAVMFQLVHDRLERQIQFVWQFQQNVSTMIAKREHVAAEYSIDHPAFDSNVGARQYLQPNFGCVESLLQFNDLSPDVVAPVATEAAKLMRCG